MKWFKHFTTKINDQSQVNSTQTLTHGLLGLWVIILTLLIGLGFVSNWILERQIRKITLNSELIFSMSNQRMLPYQIRLLSEGLIQADDATKESEFRNTIRELLERIKLNQKRLEEITANFSDSPSNLQTSRNVQNLLYREPHLIKDNLDKYISNIEALLREPSENLHAENPHFLSIKAMVLAGVPISGFSEVIKEIQSNNRHTIEKLQAQTLWLLTLNFLMLLLITIFIIFPSFHGVRQSFERQKILYDDLQSKSKEISDSRLIAFSMMEDAQIARKEAEAAQEHVKRLAAIVDWSHDAIFGKTIDGILLSWNKGAEELYGYTADEMVGQHISKIVPEAKKPELENIFKQLREGKKVSNLETCRRHKNGRLIDVSVTISPIIDSKGQRVGFSTIARDITEIKKAQRIIQERESWFRSLIENSTDILIQVNAQGIITYCSPSLTKILGYSVEERIGKSFFETIHPEDVGAIVELFKKILTSPQDVVSAQCRVRHNDGSWLRMEGVGKNLLDEPSVQSIVVNCRDITERWEAEKALRESEVRFRMMADTAPVMIWVADESMLCTFFNKHWLDFRGRDMEDEFGKGWSEGIHPEDFEKCWKMYVDHFTARTEFKMEFRLKSKDGQYRWVLNHGMPRFTSSGRFMGYIGSCIDITDRTIAEEERKKYMEQLKQSNKELEQFAFVASHDLQEPLRIVSSYVQLWAKRFQGQMDETTDKYIGYVVNNVERMQNMIHDLLSYSRVGTKNQTFWETDSNLAYDQAIANLKASIDEKKAIVTRDALPKVYANATYLVQLFQNLISNAIKYSQRQPKIHVSAKEGNGECTFAVKDNGIGIESQYFNRIFEIFQRLHTRTEYSGTGIGLSVCKKIVIQHGGRIWVESNPGEGSTFYFTLPKGDKDKSVDAQSKDNLVSRNN